MNVYKAPNQIKKADDYSTKREKMAYKFGKYVAGPLKQAFIPNRNTTFFGRNLDTPALDNANKILKEGQRIDGKEPKFPHNFAGAY